jgi:hypothetical protein
LTLGFFLVASTSQNATTAQRAFSDKSIATEPNMVPDNITPATQFPAVQNIPADDLFEGIFGEVHIEFSDDQVQQILSTPVDNPSAILTTLIFLSLNRESVPYVLPLISPDLLAALRDMERKTYPPEYIESRGLLTRFPECRNCSSTSSNQA